MFKSKVPSRQKDSIYKVSKIKQLLTKALDEVRYISPTRLSLSSSPHKRRSDESSECDSMSEVLNNLKKGYLMMKHSMNTSQPHSKFIYISSDSRFICWKSLDKDDQKRMEVRCITKVIKQRAQEFMKNRGGVKDLDCCLVIFSAERTLQLEATSQIEAELIRQELNRLLVYSRGMSLNYRYNNI